MLFHVHDDEELEGRLQPALSLARACSAHLQCLQVIPVEAYATVDAFGTFVNAETLAMLEEEGSKLRERIEARLAKEDVSWTYETTREALIPEILKAAALSDLLIIGREPEDRAFGRSGRSLLGEIICNSRTPICIPGTDSGTFDPFGTAVIAWNGSVEAANAIRQTVSLIGMASKVRVIRITEDKEAGFPDTRVLEYLSRHGVHAQLDTRAAQHGVTQDLIEYAAVAGASYIVMGGYSHSRAGEFLFGGVTSTLLREFPISLVMAH
jgi:nucleotide-binding universal stress UspA family protein